jgi:short-chain Z-isoprenyl diphosphate synthase
MSEKSAGTSLSLAPEQALPRRGLAGSSRKWLRSVGGGYVSSLVYRWYTNRLLADVRSQPIPRHVAIILDGNRRFAARNGFADRGEGHRYGARKVFEVIEWCNELDIPVITLWGLSTDNFKRPRQELDKLVEIINEMLDNFRQDGGMERVGRSVRAVGRLEMLPAETQERVRDVEASTRGAGPRLLNVAIAYGGRDEIVDAFRQAVKARAEAGESAEEIAEAFSDADLRQNLYAPDVADPELIIRTSGELRLSGFLLWQSVHSELYFCDALWPAFRKLDLLRAVRSYQARQRRFGV